MNIVTSWFNVEVRGILFFGFHMANNGWHLDGRPSTPCSKRRTWAKRWRTLSWCISTGKQWFALHISGHPLLLSLELLVGWFENMVWKLPKWQFFIVSFAFVLRQEQRSQLHHCRCQRAWGQRFAFQKPQLGTVRSFFRSEKYHLQSVWGALCIFVDRFWKVQILRCPCVIHFDSDLIGPGVSARWLRGTKGRSGNLVPWRKSMLACDETGWMGVMGPMVESSKSWWWYRIPVRIMNHDNYHDHVWSIWMLQNFHGRRFRVLTATWK